MITQLSGLLAELVFFSHNNSGGVGVLGLLLLQWLAEAYASQRANKSPPSSNLMDSCAEYDDR